MITFKMDYWTRHVLWIPHSSCKRPWSTERWPTESWSLTRLLHSCTIPGHLFFLTEQRVPSAGVQPPCKRSSSPSSHAPDERSSSALAGFTWCHASQQHAALFTTAQQLPAGLICIMEARRMDVHSLILLLQLMLKIWWSKETLMSSLSLIRCSQHLPPSSSSSSLRSVVSSVWTMRLNGCAHRHRTPPSPPPLLGRGSSHPRLVSVCTHTHMCRIHGQILESPGAAVHSETMVAAG